MNTLELPSRLYIKCIDMSLISEQLGHGDMVHDEAKHRLEKLATTVYSRMMNMNPICANTFYNHLSIIMNAYIFHIWFYAAILHRYP